MKIKTFLDSVLNTMKLIAPSNFILLYCKLFIGTLSTIPVLRIMSKSSERFTLFAWINKFVLSLYDLSLMNFWYSSSS